VPGQECIENDSMQKAYLDWHILSRDRQSFAWHEKYGIIT